MRQTVYENLQGMLADAIALKRPAAEIQSIRSQLARYDDIKKWVVRQGSSRGTVRAADCFAARERAAQIGFRDPDSIVLDDGIKIDSPEKARRVRESIAECNAYIAKEEPRSADLRPEWAAKTLETYKALRERLLAALRDYEGTPA